MIQAATELAIVQIYFLQCHSDFDSVHPKLTYSAKNPARVLYFMVQLKHSTIQFFGEDETRLHVPLPACTGTYKKPI